MASKSEPANWEGVVTLICIPLMVASRYFCLVKVYGWTVQPIFGLPQLTWLQFAGIGCFLALMIKSSSASEKIDTEDLAAKSMGRVIGPFLVLAVAWLVSH
jgi:hypothetical protein